MERDETTARGRRAVWIVAGGFALLSFTIGFVGVSVNGAARDREALLSVDLKKAQAQIDQLSSQLASSTAKLTAALDETRAHLQQAEAIVQQREAHRAALAKERAELEHSPSTFIETVRVDIAQSGFLNTYSRAVSARMVNSSHFNVGNLRGVVEYRQADGALVGSSPITISGTLLAGQTAALDVQAGQVTGGSSAAASKVIVQALSVLGGE